MMSANHDTFSKSVIRFYRSIEIKATLSPGINVMNPYQDPAVCNLAEQFFRKYYHDVNQRTYIFGINPGRFGAGVTGITFTDPVRLETICGIPNSLEKKQELSSVFIYEMINRYGGPQKFYSRFYMTAVCPLGFTKNKKNLNYYDDRNLEEAIHDFIVDSIREQLTFGADREVAVCLGEGKNYKYFSDLNRQYHFFDKIIPLAHPRFILQYRLRMKEEFIGNYLEVLRQI
jgi:hypothetical protein